MVDTSMLLTYEISKFQVLLYHINRKEDEYEKV